MTQPSTPDVPVDERGIPTEMAEFGHMSAHCPAKPCQLCTGISEIPHQTEKRKMTSWEFCQHFDVCSATIDWDKVYGHE